MRVSGSGRSPAEGLVGEAVQAQILEGERLLLLVLAGAAQQGAHARHQLAQREGLDEVVVGARVEAGDAVVDLPARGEHQHRRAVASVAQAPADLEAVEVGHGDVEDHRVAGIGAEALQRLGPVRGLEDVVAFQRERPPERVLDGGLVVNHEDSRVFGHDGGVAEGRGRIMGGSVWPSETNCGHPG